MKSAVHAKSAVRAVIADDHPLYRSSATMALERRGVSVIAECADGREALAAIRRLEPDVALVDRYMPHLDGLAVLEAITRAGLPTRVVVISGFFADDDVYRAVESGAGGVLTKAVDHRELGDVVVAVAEGATLLGGDVPVRLAGAIRQRAAPKGALLSEREQAVLALMAEGLLTPAIARQLHVSQSTVKSHTQRLFEKLRVNERAAAVAAAMRLGLLD